MLEFYGRDKTVWNILGLASTGVSIVLFIMWLHSLWVGGEASKIFVMWIVYLAFAAPAYILGLYTGWLVYLAGIVGGLYVIINMYQ